MGVFRGRGGEGCTSAAPAPAPPGASLTQSRAQGTRSGASASAAVSGRQDQPAAPAFIGGRGAAGRGGAGRSHPTNSPAIHAGCPALGRPTLHKWTREHAPQVRGLLCTQTRAAAGWAPAGAPAGLPCPGALPPTPRCPSFSPRRKWLPRARPGPCNITVIVTPLAPACGLHASHFLQGHTWPEEQGSRACSTPSSPVTNAGVTRPPAPWLSADL